MKGIKRYLKSMGITQKDLADRLSLSRPTLDNYIELYEAGEKIPKERYQIIFDALFVIPHDTKEDFLEELTRCTDLLSRDRVLGTMELSTEGADFVSGMMKNIRNDIAREGWNKNIYIFINMLLSNYRDNEIFLNLAEYFLVLNGVIDKSEITKQQIPYFTKFYRAFHELVENDTFFIEEDYQAFLHRCDEIKNINSERKRKSRKELMKLFQEKMEQNEKMGIEFPEEELMDILRNL